MPNQRYKAQSTPEITKDQGDSMRAAQAKASGGQVKRNSGRRLIRAVAALSLIIMSTAVKSYQCHYFIKHREVVRLASRREYHQCPTVDKSNSNISSCSPYADYAINRRNPVPILDAIQ